MRRRRLKRSSVHTYIQRVSQVCRTILERYIRFAQMAERTRWISPPVLPPRTMVKRFQREALWFPVESRGTEFSRLALTANRRNIWRFDFGLSVPVVVLHPKSSA